MDIVKQIKDKIIEHQDSFEFNWKVHEYLDELEDDNKLELVEDYFQIGTHKDKIKYLNVYKIGEKLYGLEFEESALAGIVEYNYFYEVMSEEVKIVVYKKRGNDQ